MTVIFSVGWGVLIFQENLDWLTLMGILLIFLAGVFINKTVKAQVIHTGLQ